MMLTNLFIHIGAFVFSGIVAIAMMSPVMIGVRILDRKGMVRHDDEV